MIDYALFPNLSPQNHRITSSASPDYNCIAWSVGDTAHWWQPGVYWPMNSPPGDFSSGVLEQCFLGLGFSDCRFDSSLETGFEKVALFSSGQFFTHAARQLSSGKWTSKLGRDVDIEHDAAEDVAGGVYGLLVQIMKRPTAAVSS